MQLFCHVITGDVFPGYKNISKTQTCSLTVRVIETIKSTVFVKRCYYMNNLDKRKRKKELTFCSASVNSSNEGRPLISNGGKCFLSEREEEYSSVTTQKWLLLKETCFFSW